MSLTIAEYPGASVVPAHKSNYGYGNLLPSYRAFTIHTPEEPADGYDVTPLWFQNPDANSSTLLYVNILAKVTQMVAFRDVAWAQGTSTADRHWKGEVGTRPPWALSDNLNQWSISCEVEGYAANIHRTMPVGSPQWNELVHMIKWCSVPRPGLLIEGYPLDRDHVHGHDEINLGKRDPGNLFPWDELMRALNTDYTQIDVSQSLNIIEDNTQIIRRLLG